MYKVQYEETVCEGQHGIIENKDFNITIPVISLIVQITLIGLGTSVHGLVAMGCFDSQRIFDPEKVDPLRMDISKDELFSTKTEACCPICIKERIILKIDQGGRKEIYSLRLPTSRLRNPEKLTEKILLLLGSGMKCSIDLRNRTVTKTSPFMAQ